MNGTARQIISETIKRLREVENDIEPMKRLGYAAIRVDLQSWAQDNPESKRQSNAPVDQLNEALNLIGFYCRDQMPDGFELRIKVTNSEMWCELEEPDGTEAEGWEEDESNPVVDACDYANHAQHD